MIDPAKAWVPLGNLLRCTRLLQWAQILNSPPKYACGPLRLEELISFLRQSCRRWVPGLFVCPIWSGREGCIRSVSTWATSSCGDKGILNKQQSCGTTGGTRGKKNSFTKGVVMPWWNSGAPSLGAGKEGRNCGCRSLRKIESKRKRDCYQPRHGSEHCFSVLTHWP